MRRDMLAKFRFLSLYDSGFAHLVAPVAVAVIIAIAGTFALIASHADSSSYGKRVGSAHIHSQNETIVAYACKQLSAGGVDIQAAFTLSKPISKTYSWIAQISNTAPQAYGDGDADGFTTGKKSVSGEELFVASDYTSKLNFEYFGPNHIHGFVARNVNPKKLPMCTFGTPSVTASPVYTQPPHPPGTVSLKQPPNFMISSGVGSIKFDWGATNDPSASYVLYAYQSGSSPSTASQLSTVSPEMSGVYNSAANTYSLTLSSQGLSAGSSYIFYLVADDTTHSPALISLPSAETLQVE